ncbi:MAG TPA: PEP-CTERM sorting domain-containing protein [Pirellulales bacterium]|jgi:hypothetical protein|nr:PEP-CTERM sorting domain-containing protein [Pirellulales bacterium]
MRAVLRLFVACLALGWAVPAGATVLYDGSLNTTPDSQGFLYFTNGSPTVTTGGGGTTLSTSVAESAGYFGHIQGTVTGGPFMGLNVDLPSPPFLPVPLDRATGYTVQFTMQESSESHPATTDRAGFSLIVLGSDKQGIELGFWTDQVWAQNDNATGGYFTHGEGTAAGFDATAVHQYDVAILGDAYRLYVDGQLQLNGSLRDYSASGVMITGNTPAGPAASEIYNTPNFLFLGDDTSEAGASVTLSNVQMFATAVPEPSSAALALVALGMLAVFASRRRIMAHGG